jgi:dipeptidyl aminopeptidase/acylaminoacyl peptidase
MRRGLLALIAASLLVAAPAHAGHPGRNGDFVFSALSSSPEGLAINLFRVPPGGGDFGADATQLTFFGGGFHSGENPSWSPDGSRIAFIDRENAVNHVAVMNADGSNPRRLTRATSAPHSAPSWSPDGTKLAFISRFGLSTINVDGTRETFLGHGAGDNPEWSPRGDEIAFECGNPSGNLCLIPAPGGTAQTVGTRIAFEPEWSPDGSKIAFTKSELSFRGGDIWVMDRDGSNPVQLTDHPAHEDQAAWSPDGRQIAFVTNRHVFDPNDPLDRPFEGVWTMNSDGSDQKLLIRVAFSVDWQPIANRPPDCEGLSASPDLMWPPNRRLRLVSLWGATDPEGDPVALEVVSVTQDEPVRGPGDPTRPDARPGDQEGVYLRAERAPRGDGRVYSVEIAATDGFRGECRKTVKVTVPRKKNSPAIESPESYDSFGR